ncbi:MAG: hypothetical protein EBS81_11755 [Gammaproteobacteria bacterium]|nr:hypothetical protein [Gammaproteobacteria bacterium]
MSTDFHAILDHVADCLEPLRDKTFHLSLWHDSLPSQMFMICSYTEVAQGVNLAGELALESEEG